MLSVLSMYHYHFYLTEYTIWNSVLISDCGDVVSFVCPFNGENCTITYRTNEMNQTRELLPGNHVMIQSVTDIHEIEIIVYNRCSTVLRHLVNVIDSCKLLTIIFSN